MIWEDDIVLNHNVRFQPSFIKSDSYTFPSIAGPTNSIFQVFQEMFPTGKGHSFVTRAHVSKLKYKLSGASNSIVMS